MSFTFQGFIHVFSKITLTKQNVIIIFDEGDLSRQNQNSIVTDEEQAVILNNTFLILSLQMTGFTDRKRFNFKSLHYDWLRHECNSSGLWFDQSACGIFQHNHHTYWKYFLSRSSDHRLQRCHFSSVSKHTFIQKWLLQNIDILNKVLRIKIYM